MSITDQVIGKFLSEGGKYADFELILPDKTIRTSKSKKPEFSIVVTDKKVYKDILTRSSLGFGEQYMLGNLDIKGNMAKALEVIIRVNGSISKSNFQSILVVYSQKVFSNSKTRSLKNVQSHYDLGNDFFKKFLDPTLTYSCAYFKDPKKDSLEKAQLQKYEHICRKLNLKKGESLIDIGCGWGGMLIYATQKYGVTGLGVTLSKEQYELANARIKELGLSEKIKVELKDYRDVKGQFDKFVSIGMFEHVGHKFYPEFFKKVKEILKPKGLGVLHTIATDKLGRPDPWLLKYIFPGGQLPLAQEIISYSVQGGFTPLDLESLRMHYGYTLGKWIENYEKAYDEVVKDYGSEFARMWRLYLYICQAAFFYGVMRHYQLTFSNGLNNEIPITREHLYKSS